MLVTTRNNDNTTTAYAFSPEHKAEAIGFYTKAYWQGKIQGFKAVFDNGETVTVGAN